MFILSLITVLINYTGILLGGIPTFILGVLMFCIARILCKKWDVYKIKKEKENSKRVDKEDKYVREKYDFFVITSVISCLYTIFIIFDVVFFGYYRYFDCSIIIFLLYFLPALILFIKRGRKSIFFNIVLFVWVSLLVIIAYGLAFELTSISVEIEFSYFILIGSTTLQFIFSLVKLINLKYLYYNSIKYREKCYKKVAKMKYYLDNGIITEEEFEKNKKEILRNIKEM
jgi:hypothetical protein